jgi:acyl dehydratase
VAMNRRRLGAEYRAPSMTVTTQHVQAFAGATLERIPVYNGSGAVAPPVFGIVPAWPVVTACLADDWLGLDLSRIVHGEQRFIYHRPIQVGDQLSTLGWLSSMMEKGPNELFTLSLRTVDSEGTRVMDQEVVCVSRGTARVPPRNPAGPDSPPPPMPDRPPDVARQVRLPENITYAYAKASGDHNRIHVDPNFARKAGLPGVIVHGLCMLAVAAQGAIEELAGGDVNLVRSLTVRFSRPLVAGSALTTRTWRVHEGARFESVGPNGKTVLRNGRIVLGE